MQILSAFLALGLLVPSILADTCFGNNTQCGAGGSGKEITVVDMQNWCFFLPPRSGVLETVNAAEGCCDSAYCQRKPCSVSTDAVAFCSKAGLTNGAQPFVSGMWTSAHLVRDTANGRIQITGTYDVNLLASLNWIGANDEGGQFDLTGTNQYKVNSPPGGKPVGKNAQGGNYVEYVSLIGAGVFCIELCSSSYGCNSDNDYTGCLVAIPGDYNSPGFTEAAGTIYRQNSPPPNSTGLPLTLVPAPLITSGPTAVASPGGTVVMPIASPVASVIPSTAAATTAAATASPAANATAGASKSGAVSDLFATTFTLLSSVLVALTLALIA
ncbi:hypothetical protein SmJEL517_g04753 [Synchytrium microbalum]|uniref:Uncharacterized protein n=1 Tax=Synchytrium microbalum TaxID=1806994 RepID=A0A507C1X7_9FUNG|nr:uncharacterized protein SmJEL517_g04753 [Synchytrium microbalum]TPX32084.1 hypothetical protein SmJEL517_g04753 [Synchytrium microbalum]